MDPAAHQLMLEHAAAEYDATWCTARIPFNGDDLDGAIVELHLDPDGVFTGEVRIPGPQHPDHGPPMTAEQLIAAAVACTVCGKEHKPRKLGNYMSWAGADGHPYRTRLYQMTDDSHSSAIEALRALAAGHHG